MSRSSHFVCQIYLYKELVTLYNKVSFVNLWINMNEQCIYYI